MKRFVLILSIVLLLPLSAAFTEQVDRINSNIDFGEDALFNITLTNDDPEQKTVRLNLGVSDSSQWLVSPSRITVPAESTVTETIRIIPRTNTRGGSYFIDLRLSTREFERVVGIPVSLGRGERGFSPSVSLFVRHDEEVDPRSSMEISTELVNRNQRTYENLELDVSSELFSTSFNLSLGGLAREGRNLYIPIDRTTPPGEYNLSVILAAPDETRSVSQFDSTFNIRPYTDIGVSTETDESFLKRNTRVNITNRGNVEATYKHNVSTTLFDQLFTSSSSIQHTEINQQRHLQWNKTVPAQDSVTFTYEVNYRPLGIATAILVLAIILYFLLRSPVVIKKETTGFEDDNDTLRIRIHVRNRSTSDVYNVTVRDTLDGILKYVEQDEVGYISPSYAKKTKSGKTRLRWDMNKLESFEERVFVYEAKPKLDILGDLNLQRSQVRFEDEKGSVRITTSNTVSVGEKQGFVPADK